MTEQEQKAFDQMREALEEIICAHPVTSTMRQVHAIVAGRNALTAANAVSHPQATEPQAQGEAITLQRWGRAENLCLRLLDPMDDGYWTPWHIAQEAIDSLQKKIAFHPQATEPALTEHERRYADNLTAMFRNRESTESIRSAMESAEWKLVEATHQPEIVRLAKVALREMPKNLATDWQEAAKKVCQSVVAQKTWVPTAPEAP